jgi:hypothetical protein
MRRATAVQHPGATAGTTATAKDEATNTGGVAAGQQTTKTPREALEQKEGVMACPPQPQPQRQRMRPGAGAGNQCQSMKKEDRLSSTTRKSKPQPSLLTRTSRGGSTGEPGALSVRQVLDKFYTDSVAVDTWHALAGISAYLTFDNIP